MNILSLKVVIQESSEASDPMASKILEVLYATEEGFAVPDDEEAGPDHDFWSRIVYALSIKDTKVFC